MQKIILALIATLALTACGEDKKMCESRMEGLKNPDAACACMKKITDEYGTTVDNYLEMGDKLSKATKEQLMKPNAEMKEFIDIGRDISINCHQHFEEKETTVE